MAEADQVEGPKLSELYEDVWKTYEYLEDCAEPSGSEVVQGQVKSAIEKGEKAVLMVNMLGVFSRNEDIEEVTTGELKYLLLPALMAYITLKNMNDDRFAVVKRAEAYFIDYLTLVKDYGITTVPVPTPVDDESEQQSARHQTQQEILKMQTDKRHSKIERFKRQKELEKSLNGMREGVISGRADDETIRDYYMCLLEKWIATSLEELEGIASEIPILKHMSKMKGQKGQATQPKTKPVSKQSTPLRPFILTKSDLQAQVIGAGYPSLPTYTIEQWYDMTYKKEGGMNIPSLPTEQSEAEAAEADKIQKEEEVDKDDPDALQKARDWDDWKDDHRRGWGNTHNTG